MLKLRYSFLYFVPLTQVFKSMIQVPPTKVPLKADDIREYEEALRVKAERQQLNSSSVQSVSSFSADSSFVQTHSETRRDVRAQRIGLKK